MIHTKISSPLRSASRRRRQTSSGRKCNGSAKIRQQDEETILPDLIPARYSSFYKRGKTHREVTHIFRKKKTFLIAPDAFIPNSSFRTVFKPEEILPVEVEVFQLRLDILKNLSKIDRENSDWEENDVSDPVGMSKSANAKKVKGIFGTQQKNQNGLTSEDMAQNKYWTKDTMPELFKRMQSEIWWKQVKDDKPNLLSMLLYLTDIIKSKRIDSYESACYYLIEIFRTFGIESLFVNQNLNILLNHLSTDENDPLNICTIRTIAQFMIEQKDLIIQLLEYALNFPPSNIVRQEVINAIRFITDTSSSDDIDLVLENISIIHDYPEDNFSLKVIIKNLASMPRVVLVEVVNEDDETNVIHPLLKKISKERWFPKENIPITLDYVLNAIITKLSDATKLVVKTLTAHLVQLYRAIGYSKEQFDRVADTLISLLSNSEADYRLIAATNLANLKKETKSIDIALLNSFINDPRILVRTECCDSLKILTGINSDTILKDCADDIPYLQTLPEENFTLQNYLNEKHRVPIPSVSTEKERTIHIDEESIPLHQDEDMHLSEVNENMTSVLVSRSLSSQIIDQPAVNNPISVLIQPEFSMTESVKLPITPVQSLNQIYLEEKQKSISSNTSEEFDRKRQSFVSVKTTISIQKIEKRSSVLSNTTKTSNSYSLQNHDFKQREDDEIEANFDSPSQTTIISDAVQIILEEHKQTVGFYRMIPNRPILIPHKITMDDIFSDQSHVIIHQHFSRLHNFRRCTFRSSSDPIKSMSFFDFNHNQRRLYEIESVQLLSSLVVRAIQLHRHHDRFIPGSFSANFPNLLTITQMQLNTSTNANTLSKLPPILSARPTSRQYAHIQSNIQARAKKEGINVYKAQSMQNTLSNLLKIDSEPSISYPLNSKRTDVTHAWLLIQLLKSEGIIYSESYLQKIIHSYPKFLPLLHTRIPHHLISVIWNDPIMKHIASIFSNKQNSMIDDGCSMNGSDIGSSIPITEDEYALNCFDYLSLIHRDDQKKRFLPPIRQTKMHLARQVLKTGFGELDRNSNVSSNLSVTEENKSISRKRRAHMHCMMSSNDNMSDQQDSIKSRSRQVYKRDYQTTSFLPIVSRLSMYH